MSGDGMTPNRTELMGQQNCDELKKLFDGMNEFFREETIIQGSEHSSILLGNLILSAYMLVIVFGTVGNILTILAVLRNKQMRTVRNFFIVNLALSDFFVCTVTAPTTLYTVLYVFWPFGTTLCKIAGSLQGFNIFLSTFSITAIALDRYVLVIFPTKRQRQQRLSLVFFSMIWLASILLAAPLFLAADLRPVFRDNRCQIELDLCSEQNERWKELSLSKESYTLGVIILQYAFPLAAIAFAYSRIARRMGARRARGGSGGGGTAGNQPNTFRKNSGTVGFQTLTTNCFNPPEVTKQPNGQTVTLTTNLSTAAPQKATKTSISSNGEVKNAAEALISQRRKSVADRHRRTNLLLVTLVVVFAFAWLPLNIFHLVNTFSSSASFSVPVFALCHLTAMCSACLNPCCYAFFNQNFRQEFLAIYHKLGLIWLYRRFSLFGKSIGLNGDSSDKKTKWRPNR
uniref:G-protein coupled receptors family 1 profile domain-containing protein n=1 Tax=Globodera rostochiensis TaxID=31243 RepID=A0A914HED7_GLORO